MRTITTTTRKADAAHQAVPEDLSIPARLRGGTIGDLTITEEAHAIPNIDDVLDSTRQAASDTLAEVVQQLRTAAGLIADGVADLADLTLVMDAATAILMQLSELGLLPAGARAAILHAAVRTMDETRTPDRVACARLVARLLEEADRLVIASRDTLTINWAQFTVDTDGGRRINGEPCTEAQFLAQIGMATSESSQPLLDEIRAEVFLDLTDATGTRVAISA